jgi:16S rRNA (cytosine967-C5)-methyltransferase
LNPVTPPTVFHSLAPTLAVQLHWTAECVLAVEQGRSLSDALPRVATPLRPGVQALTFQVMRHLGEAQALSRMLAQRAPSPAALALMHSALAVLLADPQGKNYQAHTVVNQAVEAAKQSRGTRMQAGFINACLRRFLRERDDLCAELAQETVARWNHPLWWTERLQHDHPAHWQQILEANNHAGPMVLRVNRRKITRDAYGEALKAQGLDAQALGEDGWVLAAPQPVDRLPGFSQGQVSVQDGAAQIAAGLLLDGRTWSPADRVLDACAAPGGKTAHLLERAELDLVALDVDARRCERIHDNLARLGLAAQVVCGDAAQTAVWWDGRPFDAILLDAPCTASGIVRRHPDVRWLRRASDVAQLVAIQRQLLEALWPLLKPGGRLVYCTCSVFLAEGRDQVQAFLERHTDAVMKPSPGHLLPGMGVPAGEFNDNAAGGYDGFYYARLDKVSP